MSMKPVIKMHVAIADWPIRPETLKPVWIHDLQGSEDLPNEAAGDMASTI